MRDTCGSVGRAIGAIAMLAAVYAPATSAQQLDLTFHHGRVTLRADGVTTQEILGEWARQGRTRVVNAHQLDGERVSIELDAVPEAQALARILESAAGYIARRRADTEGPSGFGLIMILSTSEAAPATWAADPAPPALSIGDRAAAPAAESSSAESLPAESSSAEDAPDHDAEPAISANERNGRSPGARSDPRATDERDPGAAIPAEELSSGRPEGARPGTPVTTPAEPPAAAPAPTAPPPDAPAMDANGRPVKKP